MIRYPHTLYVMTFQDDPVIDGGISPSPINSDGDWSVSGDAIPVPSPADPLETWVKVAECREEPTGAGSRFLLTDGSYVHFTSKIYLPELPSLVTAESRIRVDDGGEVAAGW